MPLAMAPASKSAPLVLGLAAAAALGAAVLAHGRRALFDRIAGIERIALASALAFLVWCAVSIFWSHARIASARMFIEFLAPLSCGFVALVCFPPVAPTRRSLWWCGAAALAAVVVVADLKLGLVLREATGGRVESYSYNRAIVLLSVLFWPLAALAIAEGRRWLVAVAGAPIALAVGVGDSATAQLGVLVACLTFPAAFAAPRIVRLLGLATVLLTLAIAPFMGTLAGRTMGQAVDQAMPGAHAGDRIAIWRSFEAAALKRPWFGNGFGSSLNMQNAPVAAEVPADRVTLLGSSHPHNAFLQVWVELGLVGALLLAALAVLLFRAIGRMTPWLQPYTLTTVAAGCAVALVSHGAWQAWWMATLLAAAVHFAAIPPRAASPVTAA